MKRFLLRTWVLLALLLPACGAREGPVPDFGVPKWAKIAPEQVAEAKKHGVPVAFENELGMRFVLIPAGTFGMGSPPDEEGRDTDEFQHESEVLEPFYMQITEVTKGQYRRFDSWYQSEADPRYGRSNWTDDADEMPARVGHLGGRHFAAWLTASDPQRSYRLPAENEWERACRAGTWTPYWWGERRADAGRHENLRPRAGEVDDGHRNIAPVAQYRANPWGLYDMAGNLSEVCREVYAPYPGADTEALERHAVVVKYRRGHVVRRGGSYLDVPEFARSAWRDTASPYGEAPDGKIGFRLVSPLPEPSE